MPVFYVMHHELRCDHQFQPDAIERRVQSWVSVIQERQNEREIKSAVPQQTGTCDTANTTNNGN